MTSPLCHQKSKVSTELVALVFPVWVPVFLLYKQALKNLRRWFFGLRYPKALFFTKLATLLKLSLTALVSPARVRIPLPDKLGRYEPISMRVNAEIVIASDRAWL